ncbi:MAG: hypothetical protein IKH15_11235 [Bacteroidales bacterium]|nr:hypothetical protein [Bacteroidales bacterium]MBR4647720.1 hypothetical protein [Bacteroidales bacterium]
MKEILIFYLAGYAVAAIWTAVWLLREKVEESYGFRILFSIIMGALSWALVTIYLMAWSEGRRKHDRH